MTEEDVSADPKSKEFTLPVKVFLSHPSDDDTEKVKDILERMSPQIELNIFPSTDYELDFTEAIRGSIENVDVLMVILNENGIVNQWVNQEVGVAVAKDIDIVVLAEENARKKHLLRGFVNEKNRTIVNIDKDDLEDNLRMWLEAYQEKYGINILQRVIIEDLINLKRIIDAQKYKHRDDSGLDNVKQGLSNVEVAIKRVINDVNEHGFFTLSELNFLMRNIDELINPSSQKRGTTFRGRGNNAITAIHRLKLIDKINRYVELREIEK